MTTKISATHLTVIIRDDNPFYYEEYEDVNKVERAIFDMLNNARDKE